MRLFRYAAIIVATATVTAIAYAPVSLMFYRMREPVFQRPLRAGTTIVIRNDVGGDGDFGAKRKNGRSHAGIDIKAPLGSPVFASRSGIAFCGNVTTGYGKYVMIYHPDGYQTFYGHLSAQTVSTTQAVRQGQLIGYVGKTGNAQAKTIEPHLHYEIRKGDSFLDPKQLIQ